MPPIKQPEVVNPVLEQEKVIFAWKAPTYAFRKKDRRFWVKLTAVVTLLGFIFFVAEGIMPVILLVSVLFLFYVLSSVEPESAQYEITNKGINISDKKNPWEIFRSFRFLERNGVSFVSLDVNALPGKIELIINPKDREKVESVMSKYIPKENLPLNRFDKASEWVSDKIA